MDKDINLSSEEWEAIYTSVLREYKRVFAKVVKDAYGRKKMLDDTSTQRWLNLLHKIEAHIELTQKSRN